MACRIGIPTASCFDRIITPAQMKPSSSQRKYLAQLIAEWFLGQPIADFQSAHMERGTELEPTAVAWWEFATDQESRSVGFCLMDDGLVGGSPDRLVGDDGGLEIKVPAPDTHVAYLLDDGKSLVADYRCQVQGLLWVTGRKWWEIASWSPVLPPIRVRVERDDEFIAALEKETERFVENLEAAKRKLAPLKVDRERALAAVADAAHPF